MARHEDMLKQVGTRQHDLLLHQQHVEAAHIKRDGKIMKMLKWIICGLEETTGIKYVESESEGEDVEKAEPSSRKGKKKEVVEEEEEEEEGEESSGHESKGEESGSETETDEEDA